MKEMKEKYNGYWIARNDNGKLTFHIEKPEYVESTDSWESKGGVLELPKERARIVTMDCSPVKVCLWMI